MTWCAALTGMLAGSSLASADCPADLDSNGLVDGSDLGILLLNWGNPGVGDLDGSGMVTGGDVGIMLIAWGACPPSVPVLSLTLGTSEAVLVEGESVGFATIVEIVGVGGDPVTVDLALAPSSKALAVTTDLPVEGFVFDAEGTAVFNTLVSSASLGDFSIEVTATPTEGVPVTSSVPVRVVPLTGVPVLSPLSAAPGAVNPKTSTDVVVTVGVSGTTAPPSSFRLLETDSKGGVVGEVATMLDDGVAPDVVAGDGVYTATIEVTPDPGEERRFYKACEGSIACGEGLESGPLSIEISIFPVGTAAGDPAAIVTQPDGTEFYGNQVLMIFVDGTSETRVAEVVDSVGGTVIGSIPASNAYQVGIPGDQTGEAVYAVIAQMKTVVDVDIVEPVFPSLAAELVPNDPLWASQTSLLAIRATEAWTIATGSVAIAIVDTGVDSTHPDLAGKVVILPGSDVLDGDSDPSDPSGHGTRMAGIAAAIGNNAVGIAGVSWQSPVIAVRAFGAGGSDVSLASGIVFAASNGAKVISVSGVLRESSAVLADAVAFAQERGCLVVAAAGNQNQQEGSVQTYPCSLPGVVCVGALDRDGDPLAGTNAGPWISLAAPGESVSTLEAGGGYGTATGTSPAAAIVAGSAALVWSNDPSLDAEAVRDRLLGGAEPLAGSESLVGSGRVDVFESTFNGSFELPAIGTWSTQGTVSFIESLGPLVPTDGTRMAYLSTGPAAAQQAASLRAEFVVQPGVSEFAISFDYDFISEEWPEWVGSSFDDEMRIVLEEPDGSELLLAVETINDSLYFPIEGINFPGGDRTVGHTGWKTVSAVVPITKGPGSYTVRIEDAGDNLYDSVVLVDRIRLVGDPNAVFCGSPASGNCCEARKTPFCVDAACCNAVCLYDPTCCQVAWDARCADVALALCDGLCGPPPTEICNNGFDDDYDTLTDCEDPDCTGATNCGNGPGEQCGNGQDDDGDGLVDCDDPDCSDFPNCGESFCGDPEAGGCCDVHPRPFCSDGDCCDAVCAADPYCCTTAWDDLCAAQAIAACGCAPTGNEACGNGQDDDGDGLVDCNDPDCADSADCGGSGIVNDECAGALPLLDGDNELDTTNATTGSDTLPEACAKFGSNVIHRDLWFTYTATCSGTVTMSFCSQDGGTASFDTRLAVWSGDCKALSSVACNDDDCQQYRSRVTFEAICGETYLVQIGAFAAHQAGTARLSIECDGSPCGN